MVGEHDGNHPAERAPHRLEHLDTLRDVLLHLLVFLFGQPRGLVEEFAAHIELADIMQQRRGAHVLDPLVRQIEAHRNRRGVHRHAIRVVLRVRVLRDEVAEDEQNAMIGLAELVDLRGLVFVERAHRVAGHDQDAAPDSDVEPARRPEAGARARGREEDRVVPGHQDDQEHAAQRGQRRVPTAVVVGRPERREGVEAQHHPLAVYHQVQEQTDREQREQNPELFVDLFDPSEAQLSSCGLPVDLGP